MPWISAQAIRGIVSGLRVLANILEGMAAGGQEAQEGAMPSAAATPVGGASNTSPSVEVPPEPDVEPVGRNQEGTRGSTKSRIYFATAGSIYRREGKYHERKDCRGLSRAGSPIEEVSLDETRPLNLLPCDICNRPPGTGTASGETMP